MSREKAAGTGLREWTVGMGPVADGRGFTPQWGALQVCCCPQEGRLKYFDAHCVEQVESGVRASGALESQQGRARGGRLQLL